MIAYFLVAVMALIAFVFVIVAVLVVLACHWACTALRDSWRHARAVIEETQDGLQAIREAGYRAFDEHAETALRVARTEDWDEALERLTTQEGTEQ